ncbi:MAG: hypothetical protein NC124_18445 [Clostridium sp.]|nr:hypothetical protein [Clostridium sp.]
MRGEKEQQCLDRIKNATFTRDGVSIKHPFIGKIHTEVCDDEFAKEQIWYVNSDCHKNYFGLLETDRNEFEQILRKADPNQELSNFPDFVFPNGFIEHFQVTSSLVTRKGSNHTKKESEFKHRVGTETKQIEDEWNQTPSFDAVRSKSWDFTNPPHSHEFLMESFKNNWEHHMDSYGKYNGAKEIGVFMIEYPEFALSMCENVYCDWIDGMAQGDMREQKKFKEYRLSRDKKLLEYVYRFRGQIKYVIFVNQVRYEVIRTDNIPYLLKLIPWDFVIYPLVVTTVSTINNISISANLGKGGEQDDKT